MNVIPSQSTIDTEHAVHVPLPSVGWFPRTTTTRTLRDLFPDSKQHYSTYYLVRLLYDYRSDSEGSHESVYSYSFGGCRDRLYLAVRTAFSVSAMLHRIANNDDVTERCHRYWQRRCL